MNAVYLSSEHVEQLYGSKCLEEDTVLAHQLRNKYGPKWYWCVEDTEEDTILAYQLRDKWEDEQYQRQIEQEKRDEEEHQKKCAEKCAEKSAERALMSFEEQWRAEMTDMYDSEMEWEKECLNNDYAFSKSSQRDKEEQEYYKEQGWIWDPRG